MSKKNDDFKTRDTWIATGQCCSCKKETEYMVHNDTIKMFSKTPEVQPLRTVDNTIYVQNKPFKYYFHCEECFYYYFWNHIEGAFFYK